MLFALCFTNKSFTQVNLSANSGFFTQNFNWSVAGNYAGQNPNIYSELIWKKIKGVSFGMDADYQIHKKYFLSGMFRFGSIRSGVITDADYKTDNRTDRSYYAQFSSGYSNLFGSSLSAGYVLLNKNNFQLRTSIGFGYQKQNLSIKPGKEDSSIITTGLNSSYRLTTSGPLITADVQYNLTKRIYIGILFKFQFINYDAKADWNLATNFQHPVSFRQMALGYRLNNQLSLGYSVNKNLKLFITVENDHLNTNGGDDVLYKSSGEVLISHFNGAKENAIYGVVGINLKI